MNTFWKQQPVRDKQYLCWISRIPCLICQSEGLYRSYYAFSQAHHVPEKGNSGKGTKCSDLRAIPLCNDHHSEYHTKGRSTFSDKYGIDYERVISKLNAIYGVDNDCK